MNSDLFGGQRQGEAAGTLNKHFEHLKILAKIY